MSLNIPTTLSTERLALRPFNMGDAPNLFKIVQETDIFRYFPNQTAWEMEKVERNIKYQIDQWQLHGYGQMAVTLAETGRLMGWCGLEFISETGETEVGYLLSKAFWGKGYATEAARESVRFGLETIGLKEIVGLTDPQNIASQKVLEKCGMAFTRRQAYFGMEMFRYAIQV